MSSRSCQLKDEILNQIAEQIKGLQISQQGASYGEDTIHIAKSNIHVQCLLDLLDNILLHGLERVEFGYWPFVKELTHSEIVKYIVNHPQVTSDLDKGRVWIFTAFSDGLLESYIRLFVDNQLLARRFYTRNAFVRDKERIAILQTLVSGLDFVSFALDQEWPYLGYGNQPPQDDTCATDAADEGSQAASLVTEKEMHIFIEKVENFSTLSSSSLSSASTITRCLSPIGDPKEQTVAFDESTTDCTSNLNKKPVKESIEVHESSRLFNTNVQTEQVLGNENNVFDSSTRKTKRHKVGDEKDNCVTSLCESPTTKTIAGLDEHYDKWNKLLLYEADSLHLSGYHKASLHPQESCSSLNGSLQSTDSLDQFCRDFESSVNLPGGMSLNCAAALQLCENMEDWEESKNSSHQTNMYTDDHFKKSIADLNTKEVSKYSDKSASYDGIILGLPKRPSLQEIPVTSGDIRVDQNKILALSLEVFETNGEQFHRDNKAVEIVDFIDRSPNYIAVVKIRIN